MQVACPITAWIFKWQEAQVRYSQSVHPGAISATVPINLWTEFGHAWLIADLMIDPEIESCGLPWSFKYILVHVYSCYCVYSVFANFSTSHEYRTPYSFLLLTKTDQSQIISPTQLMLEASLNSDLRDWSYREFLQRRFPTVCRGLVSAQTEVKFIF